MKKLDGKVAIITGASKGIGEGITKVFAKYGAKLVLAARSDKVIEFAKELADQGYEAIGVRTDVSDKASVEALVKTAVERYGTIDILVNNAGVCLLGDLISCSDEDRDYHININIKGVWNVTKAVAPYMMDKKDGKIVVMSSVTGDMVADPGEAAYATTKAALVGFTKAMARELADYNITINAICPGYVRTPLVENMAVQSCPENPESVIEGIASAVPLKRLARPEEIGELAAFLSCYESSYITGAQIVIDGGSTLPETFTMGV
ncbi:MAG: SDR family oxidoreductase UcpA [Ruminococcaceae bacterium]|nr:SDR family oxidoreductase UcpA [Oscillospiraceae bacterium]